MRFGGGSCFNNSPILKFLINRRDFKGSGFKVKGLASPQPSPKGKGAGFKIQVSGFKIHGSRFMVHG